MEQIFLDISIVVICAAALSWLAVLFKQPIIIAYLLCGIIVGPWGLSLVKGVEFVDAVSRIGVTLLLFLAGIVLHPRRLFGLFRQTMLVTLCSSLLLCLFAYLFALATGFDSQNSIFIGLSLMFSSTILVVKLLPTTTLHHKHMGAFCIAVLIAQDLIAISLLIVLSSINHQSPIQMYLLPIKGMFLIGFAFLFEQFVLRKIMEFSDRYHETLYLLSLGWCLGMAMLAQRLGFSHEVGAFFAGLSLARSPIALFLSEELKVLRDFFLVFFFFVFGARLDIFTARKILFPAIILGVLLVFVKALLFNALFKYAGEIKSFSKEAGIRLGQASEFSLIIAIFAYQSGDISLKASQIIQIATIFTMIVSSYLTVFFYPTPLGTSEKLQQD